MTSTIGNPSPPQGITYTFWITRDSDADGNLSSRIKVWTTIPYRNDRGRGAFWLAPDDDYYGEFELSFAWKHARVAPDDDRQCLRVAGDRERLAGETLDRPHVS